jgi:Leucine-rich repeat (LRR) protein
MSIETEQYMRLKNKIYSDLNTKTFSINYWEKLKEIPHEISLLQQLEQLSVYKNKSIKKYPKALADLPNLHHLSLRFNHLKHLPEVIGNLKRLETLNLSNNRFSASCKWEPLAGLDKLKVLNLNYALQNLSELPEPIGRIPFLKELHISGNKLHRLPDSLEQLRHLERLYCDANDFDTFPSILTRLPRLKFLQLPAKALRDLPDKALELQYIEEVKFTAKSHKNTPYIFAFERLLKSIKANNFDKELQLFYLAIIRGDILIEELSNEQLLNVLNCGSPSYTNQALLELDKRIHEGIFGAFRWPQAGDKIIIKGKLKGKVSELKKRLQEINVQTGIKVGKQATHLLLGSMPGATHWMIDSPLTFLTEQSIVAQLNRLQQPYLLSTSEPHNLEHIRELLHSERNENILLALEILKGGGLPMCLLTELFLVYKFTPVQKIKRMIYEIVGQYAPMNFVTALKSRKPIGDRLSEMTRCQNLEYYCQTGQLDKRYIAFYLYNRGNYGILFALMHLDTPDKKAYFSEILKTGHLSLSGLDLTHLPEDMGELSGLTHLDISYNKFTEVPAPLFKCKELKSLYIRGLYEIHKKPDDLWKIPSLETVYVGYNNKWAGYSHANSVLLNGLQIIGR